MNLEEFIGAAQWVFLGYFLILNLGYMTLNGIAMFSLRRYMEARGIDSLPSVYANFELPTSVLVPACNEEATITSSIRAMLQLKYPEFEVVVINDGSTDQTLARLIEEFDLAPFPEAYRIRLETQPVRTVYRSSIYPNLRVIDKANGGKADALNAGINAARYPLYCAVDADSVLQPDSLQRIVQPFLDDPNTVACGGTVRIANGCTVSDGFMEKIGLPRNPLALLQVVEYLRAFLFGRLGWSPVNALLIISGAFGLFRKETVISAGGYRTDTVGEDMELVVRIHRLLRKQKRPYRITFVPDPICWTEAPEDLRTLKSQRGRWQHGLAESLTMNMGMLFHPKGGAVSWFAFPFMFFFEFLGPLLEVSGYLFFAVAFWQGWISLEAYLAFMLVAVGLGVLLSTSALLLEELSFHIYPHARHMAVLFAVAIAENFGYRQLNSVFRLLGMLRWMTGMQGRWGDMQRSATWTQSGPQKPESRASES